MDNTTNLKSTKLGNAFLSAEIPDYSNFKPEKPEWNFWGNVDKVNIWEAVALSCDMEPRGFPQYGGFNPDIFYKTANSEYNDFFNRLNIIERNLEKLRVVQDRSEKYKPWYCLNIDLKKFSEFLESLNSPFSIPKSFPRKIKASINIDKKNGVEIKKLLILVHGLGADEKKFWGSTTASLPSHPKIHENYDVKFWGYETSKSITITRILKQISNSPSHETIEQLGEHLWSQLRLWITNKSYTKVQLIGHSMGGLVIASALAYGLNINEKRDENLIQKIQKIAFIATPLGGANIAKIINIIYKPFGQNIHTTDLEENSVSRKSIVSIFINLALKKNSIPLRIFRAANDFVVQETELKSPLSENLYTKDVLSGDHSPCIQNLEAGHDNLEKIIQWVNER